MGIVFRDGYIGFSTKQYEKSKSFILTDVNLVKEDLLNHIFTRKGERLKMPTFGTRIPDLVYEPLDERVLGIIQDDLTTVFTYDPRVTLNELRIIPLYQDNAVKAIADLTYVYLNFTGVLDIHIEFEG
jgi:phage baseplate assembly protein W